MEKENTYIVEVSFETVVVKDQDTDEERQVLELHTEVATFKDFNKSEAKQRAQNFFDKTVRYGLTKSGGSVIKALVPANSIKNIALVDYTKYLEEVEAANLKTGTGAIPANVEEMAKVATVDTEVRSNELPAV